jgi:hypothetical protein
MSTISAQELMPLAARALLGLDSHTFHGETFFPFGGASSSTWVMYASADSSRHGPVAVWAVSYILDPAASVSGNESRAAVCGMTELTSGDFRPDVRGAVGGHCMPELPVSRMVLLTPSNFLRGLQIMAVVDSSFLRVADAAVRRIVTLTIDQHDPDTVTHAVRLSIEQNRWLTSLSQYPWWPVVALFQPSAVELCRMCVDVSRGLLSSTSGSANILSPVNQYVAAAMVNAERLIGRSGHSFQSGIGRSLAAIFNGIQLPQYSLGIPAEVLETASQAPSPLFAGARGSRHGADTSIHSDRARVSRIGSTAQRMRQTESPIRSMTLMEFLNAANGFLLSTGMSQESIKRTATIPSVCASVAQLMTALVTNYPSVEWTPGKAPDGAYRITGRSVRDPSRGVIVSVRPVVRQFYGE